MKNLLLILIAISISVTSFSQEWVYGDSENKFEGISFQLGGVHGNGEFPYNNPLLGIRKTKENGIEVIMTEIGYQYGTLIKMYVDSGKVYEFSIDISEDNMTIFIRMGDDRDEFFDLLRKGTTLYTRVYSKSGNKSFTFPLKGSTKAINHAIR